MPGEASALDFFVSPFIEPENVNNSQLLFLTAVYSLILFQSSGLIAEGSELLLLVPAVAGLVGSIVLPILGAVPDGVMTLFSGLGENAQDEVGLGMGVLAGSTVMLLTFPWFIAIVTGRVPIKNGEPDYTDKKSPPGGMFDSGISFKGDVSTNAKVMIATTLIYLVIQVPASFFEYKEAPTNSVEADILAEAQAEKPIALIGMVLSTLCFCGYLFQCYWAANTDKVLQAVIKGINAREITLGGALEFSRQKADPQGGLDEPLANSGEIPDKMMSMLEKVAAPFFNRYDKDKSKSLSETEFRFLLQDLGESDDYAELATEKFNTFDTDKSGSLEFREFVRCLYAYMTDDEKRGKVKDKMESDKKLGKMKTMPAYGVKNEENDEEEEEVPEDISKLPKDQQQKRIIFRALWMMILGTLIVLFVSDPFVDVLNVWGKRFGIPGFYVSFVVAPFASNASELLSAYVYAAKKTKAAMTTSLSTLIGAACMNNTFVLAIFFGLMYFKGLAWRFTAETISIVVVQWVIGAMAILLKSHNMFHGILILTCYPLCLAIVYVLENFLGLD